MYIYIGIYVRVVRVSCVCFLRILRKLYDLSILKISGKFNVRGIRVFNVSTRMCTIKIKWRKVSKVFRNAHTDTRAQL